MTSRDLLARGFVQSHLPKFHGYCPVCERYTLTAWWEGKHRDEWRRRETTACEECKVVDYRDVKWIEADYPVMEMGQA
jgi:hypothetical protein